MKKLTLFPAAGLLLGILLTWSALARTVGPSLSFPLFTHPASEARLAPRARGGPTKYLVARLP
jgi:hypothetical protein